MRGVPSCLLIYIVRRACRTYIIRPSIPVSVAPGPREPPFVYVGTRTSADVSAAAVRGNPEIDFCCCRRRRTTYTHIYTSYYISILMCVRVCTATRTASGRCGYFPARRLMARTWPDPDKVILTSRAACAKLLYVSQTRACPEHRRPILPLHTSVPA